LKISSNIALFLRLNVVEIFAKGFMDVPLSIKFVEKCRKIENTNKHFWVLGDRWWWHTG
jgi:hypothetical protein